MPDATLTSIDTPKGPVSALLLRPPDARALLVLGHGAGAGMRHAFLEAVAVGLAARGVASLRYQFPYIEAGRKAPDRAPVLQATVRAAVARAAELVPELPRWAGGKSMGGRMTSLAEAEQPLAGVEGLVFLGFPLHSFQTAGTERAAHLLTIERPMLFVQGTRDRLARLDLIEQVVAGLGPRAAIHVVDGGDHSFAVLKRSGRDPDQVMAEVCDAVTAFVAG